MGLFGNLKTEGLEETQDRLGGFSPLNTNAYEATIKAAYAGESTGGAKSVTVIADLEGGREYRETIWITNKKGENFFLNPNDKTKKVPLPGFTIMDDLCLVATDKPLSEQETEEKVMNIYDFEQRKELPKSVQMLTGLLGKKAYLGIIKQIENKNEKQGDEYVPVADTREVNLIEKVFHYPSKITVTEARNNQEPAFFDAWVERNQGKDRDRRTIKDGAGGAGKQGRPAGVPPKAGDTNTAPRKSLFG